MTRLIIVFALVSGCYRDTVRSSSDPGRIAYRVHVTNLSDMRMPASTSTWTNSCVEIPRLTGEDESTRQWVSRIHAEIEADDSRRLVSVSYPLDRHDVDLALVCFTAPRFD